MKTPARPLTPLERTRRAILDAMADVIVETNGVGFSVQAVADRAGLTHRTIYNHFPSRDALCEAFSQYVDELLEAIESREAAEAGILAAPADQSSVPIASLPAGVGALYRMFGEREHHVRAYVMLMFGNRHPLESWKQRTRAFEKQVAARTGPRPPLAPRQATAAIRLFVSSFGWHLLTEHCGLSTEEAAVTGAWATQTLLEAATGRRGATPTTAPIRKQKKKKRAAARPTSRGRT